MKEKILEFLTVAFAALFLALVLYVGIPWAMEEPIYCGNNPCSEARR